MPKIKDIIAGLVKEANEESVVQLKELGPSLGLVPKKPAIEKEAEQTPDADLTLESLADAFEEMDKIADKIAASPLAKNIVTLLSSPKFWIPTAAATTGAGFLIGKQLHKNEQERQMYDIAKEYYGMGARNAASYIRDMLLRNYYSSNGQLAKTSAYLRKVSKELKAYRKRDQAIKLAQKMVSKGLISQDSFFDKMAELEKEDNLEVLNKAIDIQLVDDFGKIASKSKPEPYSEGIYSIL